jgi:hypothetical protein
MTSKQASKMEAKLAGYAVDFGRIASNESFSKRTRVDAKRAMKRAVALAKVCTKLAAA